MLTILPSKPATNPLTQTQELDTDAHWQPTGHMGLVALKRREMEKKRESIRYQLGASRSGTEKIHCECEFDKEEGNMVYYGLDAKCCAWLTMGSRSYNATAVMLGSIFIAMASRRNCPTTERHIFVIIVFWREPTRQP